MKSHNQIWLSSLKITIALLAIPSTQALASGSTVNCEETISQAGVSSCAQVLPADSCDPGYVVEAGQRIRTTHQPSEAEMREMRASSPKECFAKYTFIATSSFCCMNFVDD